MNTELIALVRRIWRRAYLDSEEECARWIVEYIQKESNSHKHVVSGKRPTLKEIAQAKEDYLKKVGYVDRMDIIAHDFVQGIAWAIQYYQAACASGAVDTVAARGDFSCWMSLGGDEQCKELCNECSGELARKSSEGQP